MGNPGDGSRILMDDQQQVKGNERGIQLKMKRKKDERRLNGERERSGWGVQSAICLGERERGGEWNQYKEEKGRAGGGVG